jgi:hypothetical protein
MLVVFIGMMITRAVSVEASDRVMAFFSPAREFYK